MLLSHFAMTISNGRPVTGRKQTGMSRIWRMIAPVAVAGGLIAVGVAPAAQAASPSTYGVTISATSPNYPGAVQGKVDGFALVIYKTSFKNWNTGVISGTVTGALSGDVATLLAEPFHAKSFTAAATMTLSGAPSEPYSFSVKPSLATKYEVQVTTGSTVDATSAQQTVYVSAGGSATHQRKHCSRTVCTYSYRLYQTMPSSAYNTEVKKHLYLYLLVGHPNFPKYFDLSTSAKASKARKINAGEFERILTFYIKIRGNTRWISASCTKDNEGSDGLGLPLKRHNCGAKRLSITTVYVG